MADTYEIVKTEQVLDTSDLSHPAEAERITFRSKSSGSTGTVTLPLAGLTPELVHQAVEARVATLDAIHAL